MLTNPNCQPARKYSENPASLRRRQPKLINKNMCVISQKVAVPPGGGEGCRKTEMGKPQVRLCSFVIHCCELYVRPAKAKFVIFVRFFGGLSAAYQAGRSAILTTLTRN